MKIPFAQILRNLVAVLGLGLFGLSVGRLLWTGEGRVTRYGVADEGIEEEQEVALEVPEGKVRETRGGVDESPPAPKDSGELVVVLDPGHGGSDPGSVREGHYEKNINLAVALKVRKLLEAEEIRVVMTRSKDVAMELEDRVAVANRYRKSIFVSIHQNASLETAARGVETYFAWPRPASVVKMQRDRYGIPEEYAFEDERGQALAEKVQEAFCSTTSAVSRGTKNRNFVVIRWVHGPAVLVECGFLSNAVERDRLLSESYQDKAAQGIADGLVRYVKESDGEMLYGLRFPNGDPPEPSASARRAVVQAIPADS
jgi:N-acetylmuramoyl-L-alanine amidase